MVFGLLTGDSSNGMSVHRLSKLAMQCLPATAGRKLGWISLASSFFQFIGLNHLWDFISSLPFCPLPRRLLASFCSSALKRECASLDRKAGSLIFSFIILCCILSREPVKGGCFCKKGISKGSDKYRI